MLKSKSVKFEIKRLRDPPGAWQPGEVQRLMPPADSSPGSQMRSRHHSADPEVGGPPRNLNLGPGIGGSLDDVNEAGEVGLPDWL